MPFEEFVTCAGPRSRKVTTEYSAPELANLIEASRGPAKLPH